MRSGSTGILRARGMLGDITPEAQEAYLAERAGRVEPGRMVALLARAGTEQAIAPGGDETPDGWLGRESQLMTRKGA